MDGDSSAGSGASVVMVFVLGWGGRGGGAALRVGEARRKTGPRRGRRVTAVVGAARWTRVRVREAWAVWQGSARRRARVANDRDSVRLCRRGLSEADGAGVEERPGPGQGVSCFAWGRKAIIRTSWPNAGFWEDDCIPACSTPVGFYRGDAADVGDDPPTAATPEDV